MAQSILRRGHAIYFLVPTLSLIPQLIPAFSFSLESYVISYIFQIFLCVCLCVCVCSSTGVLNSEPCAC
jgi:hypothetical protein